MHTIGAAEMTGAPRTLRTLRAAAESATLERHVEQAILDRLRLNGWRCHRLKSDVHAGNRRQKQEREEVGTPDYIAIRVYAGMKQRCIGGECSLHQCDAFYIEAKSARGKLRTSQIIWHAEARKAGYIVIVASSIEQFEQEYRRYFGELL